MDALQKLIFLLKRYIEKNWYGQILISMEAGSIVNLKVTENIKL